MMITEQEMYDAFNKFMFSNDRKTFNKLMARILLSNMVKGVPGDIVELGVFKGSGLMTWLKIKHINMPNKRVVGFDYFNTDKLIDSLEGADRFEMQHLFRTRNYEHDEASLQHMHDAVREAGFEEGRDYELVQGDVTRTVPDYVAARPGFRASLVYFDLDLDNPTYDALCFLWERIPSGGIVVFDEYAYPFWSESNGVDRFFKGTGVKLTATPFECPTAFAVKP